jgi:hypothetical protein
VADRRQAEGPEGLYRAASDEVAGGFQSESRRTDSAGYQEGGGGKTHANEAQGKERRSKQRRRCMRMTVYERLRKYLRNEALLFTWGKR